MTPMLAHGIASARAMHGYRGESGEWIFLARPSVGVLSAHS